MGWLLGPGGIDVAGDSITPVIAKNFANDIIFAYSLSDIRDEADWFAGESLGAQSACGDVGEEARL